jgi:hypothetical protein
VFVLIVGAAGLYLTAWLHPSTLLLESVKTDSVLNRLEYWQQAKDAFLRSPLLGSGPGTFSLDSLQNQHKPGISSWFAHSALLQTGSELGVLGLVGFVWLVISHFIYLHTHKEHLGKSITATLLLCVSLLLFYSLYEFVLDYFVTWMLVWAAAGLIVGARVTNTQETRSIIYRYMLWFLVIFYTLWVTSFFVSLTTNRSDVAFYLAPFDATQALAYVDASSMQTLTDRDVHKIVFFHRKNSSILSSISKLKEKQNDGEASLLYAKQAAYASPQNSEYYSRYFLLLAKYNQLDLLGNEMLSLGSSALPEKFQKQIEALRPFTHGFGLYYKNWMIPEQVTYANGYASLYYRLGIADLRDVPPTEQLLILARDIYPDLAYLHVELAAFYQYVKNDPEKAREILVSCQHYPSAAKQCKEQLTFPLYPPAEYKQFIL